MAAGSSYGFFCVSQMESIKLSQIEYTYESCCVIYYKICLFSEKTTKYANIVHVYQFSEKVHGRPKRVNAIVI